jgi:hypothetical protein
VIARVAAVTTAALAIMAGAVPIASPLLASASSTGAGISAAPVCLAHAMTPGHSYELETNGLTPGVRVYNQGTGSESLFLRVIPDHERLPGLAVPPGWVSFTYPRHLLIFSSDHLSLGAGVWASVPVTVAIPRGARPGTYVGRLALASYGSSGQVTLGAGASTLVVFTVSIARPHWTALQLASAGSCWAMPGQRVSWQQWAGTPDATPPPGWAWQGGAWTYIAPPGWVWSWVTGHEGQDYRGGHPVVGCANPAAYPDPAEGNEIGGQNPVTSTRAGCAAWLAESRAGTLRPERSYDPGHSGHAEPVRHVQADAATTKATQQDETGPAILGAAVIALILAGLRVIVRHLRRRGRPRY